MQSAHRTGTAPQLRPLDRALQRYVQTGRVALVQVIVRPAAGFSHADVAEQARACGGRVVNELPIVPAVTVQMSRSQLLTLAREQSVRRISIDAQVLTAAVASNQWTALLPQTLTYQTLGIDDLTLMGDTIGVAVIDSGIVGGTAGVVTSFFDLLKSATSVSSVAAYDDNGHGTHVAGLMEDSGVQSYGNVGGVSPAATSRRRDHFASGCVLPVMRTTRWPGRHPDPYYQPVGYRDTQRIPVHAPTR